VIATALGLLLAANLSSAGADEHLLAGAQRFREGRFEEALVEFRVAQRLGAQAVDPYVASALVKLGRHEEAIELYGGGDTPGPDPLVDYYRALACWGARLYGCADRLLAGVGDRSGPRIGAEATRLRAEIAAELRREPSKGTIDWYAGRCVEERRTGRHALALAYCREAAGLAGRRADRYRLGELQAAATPSARRGP
jgi:tetratricopeptide (TPR) repeat protein